MRCLRYLRWGHARPLSTTMNEESSGTIPQYTLPPIEEDPVPAVGGALTFPIPENPSTLNPLKIKNAEIYNLFTLIYEPPIRIGADGRAQPVLARNVGSGYIGHGVDVSLTAGVVCSGRAATVK